MKEQRVNRDMDAIRLLRYLDGELASSEVKTLQEDLASSESLRARFRELAEGAIVVADEARAEGCRSNLFSPVTTSTRSAKRPALLSWAVAASVAFLLPVIFLLSGRAPETIVEVAEVSGAVQWTGAAGRVEPIVERGQGFGGGIVKTLSSNSAVLLRFDDGSEIQLAGDGEATVSENNGEKRVHLGRGDLVASIVKQAPGRPFLLHTPTADLEVLGTRFELQSEPDETLLSVSEGAVRIMRKVDGEVVEVPARHEAKASLDRAEKLEVTPIPTTRREWTSDFSDGPGDAKGQWLPPSRSHSGKTLPSRLAAQPHFVPNGHEGPVTIYRVGIRVPRIEEEVLEVEPGSLIRLKGRLGESAGLEVMLSLCDREGSLGGNYFHRTESLPAGSWEIELPVEQFRRWRYSGPTGLPTVARLRDVVFYTINLDAGLEFESIAVIGPANSPPTAP